MQKNKQKMHDDIIVAPQDQQLCTFISNRNIDIPKSCMISDHKLDEF